MTHATRDRGNASRSVVIALAGVAVMVGLFAVAALPVLRGDDDSPGATAGDGSVPATPAPTTFAPMTTEPPATTTTTTTTAPTTTTTEPPATTTTTTTTEPPATTTTTTTTTSTTSTTTTTTEPPDESPVAESRAVVRNGQIFLEGAVPTQEAGDQIVALAAEILGPDNVIDNYFVDPRASDPNLGNITVEDTINFNTASAVILPEGEPLLNQGLVLMTIRPSVTIRVVGHTDSRGSDEYNFDLSRRRAEAVKQWFVDRGIEAERITTEGRGKSEPIADNSTAEGQRLNRRIQFFLENLLVDS